MKCHASPHLQRRTMGTALAAALGVVLAAATAAATLVPALDLESLTGLSTLVCTGRVTGRESRFEGERIVTVSTVAIDERLACPPSIGDEVRIVTLGGEVGDVGMWVPGESRLELGERYLLFARPGLFGMRITGMAQGSLRIVTDEGGTAWVLPAQVCGLATLANGEIVPARPFLESPVPLSRVLERIRAILGHGP